MRRIGRADDRAFCENNGRIEVLIVNEPESI
jgi:hypothetical protein